MALITKAAEIKKLLKADAALTDAGLPSFDLAESQYLIPIIGYELYDALSAAYAANTLTDDQKALLLKCQGVIAPFALLTDLPFMQATLGNNGLTVTMSEEVAQPAKWQFKEAQENLYVRGYQAQEALIMYLQAHKSTFPLWSSSDYNSAASFAFIRNGNDLSGALGVQQPHRCYMLMKGILNTQSRVYLATALGDEYFDALNARILAGTTTAQEDKILGRLRAVAARKAMEYACIELNIRFSGSGFTIVDKLADQPEEGRTNAAAAQLERLRDHYKTDAENTMQEVIKYMNANASATVFAEYFGSDLYAAPSDTETKPIDNSRYNGIFIM